MRSKLFNQLLEIATKPTNLKESQERIRHFPLQEKKILFSDGIPRRLKEHHSGLGCVFPANGGAVSFSFHTIPLSAQFAKILWYQSVEVLEGQEDRLLEMIDDQQRGYAQPSIWEIWIWTEV